MESAQQTSYENAKSAPRASNQEGDFNNITLSLSTYQA